jgi:hypothetical protein
MSSYDEHVKMRRAAIAAYEAEERAKFFAKADAEVPPVVIDYPPCPICTSSLTYEDGWWCEGCHVAWDESGGQGVIDVEYARDDPLHPLYAPAPDQEDPR